MVKNNTIICMISGEGAYRHPLYYVPKEPQGPILLEYCPIEELDEALNRYSQIYNTNEVFLEGNREFVKGIKEIIMHNNITKYGHNTLNIRVTGD